MAPSRPSPLMMLLGAIFFLSAHVFAAAAVLGVDLGTEFIKGALVKPGIPLEIVLTKDSRRKETSAVAFKPSPGGVKDGAYPERLYGADAMALAARFPGEVYPNLKTLLGRVAEDSIVQEYAARHPAMQLGSSTELGTAAFKTKTLSSEEDAWMVEELLAMQLQSIQKNAEITAGDGSPVRSIVLTVPPFYTIEEKRAVATAAELAGLKVLSLISDGLAVGLNYATSRQFPNINEGAKPEYNMVFDMGAGSCKATVMRFQSRSVKDVGKFNKTVQEVQVLGSGWDRSLGGDALNYLIVDDMVSQFVQSKGAQKIGATAEGVKSHGRTMAKLSKEAERARHVLSANQNTVASFEGLYEDVDFKYKITRAEFESMAEAHVERVAATISDALKMSNLDIGDIDSVILHGGASRTPFVQKALEKAVGSLDKIRTNVNSDEAAVFGAGFRAAELSPSFRVKEIRISDGIAYPTGLKWVGNNGKSHKQRLWTASSVLGGPAKEVTFNEPKDEFEVTVYQQYDEADKDLASFQTVNLTKTVQAIQEQYPSCEESDIKFKLGMKLNSDNGEVEIARAAVECEADVPEKGFVDGVKNLFGFGKKDQKPLKDGETAGEADEADEADASADTAADAENKPESSASSSATESAASTKSSEGGEATAAAEDGEKAEAKQREIVSIPVEIKTNAISGAIQKLSVEETTKSKDRLKAFAASDRARLAREEALNQLEAFTYRIRDKLEDESFIAMSIESERAKISELSSFIGDWLYGDGADATKDELKSKLKELETLVSPIQKRVDEAASRPDVLASLKQVLNTTETFLQSIDQQIGEYEAWHASASSAGTDGTAADPSETPAGDFDGLEDDESSGGDRSMDDVIKERGPVPPLYKREDLDEVKSLYQSVADWLKEIEPRQEALGATDDPVLLAKDILAKRDKLDQVGKDLAMKGVRNFDRNTKKAKDSGKSKKKDKKSKTSSGEPAAHTIKLDDDTELTEEDIARLLEQFNAEKDGKKAEDTKGEAKPEHDEL